MRNITRKKFTSITQFTIEFLNFLLKKRDIDEFFRSSLETAMNDLLKAELSALLRYEPYDKVGFNSGNSRNGTYSGKFKVQIFGVNSLLRIKKEHPKKVLFVSIVILSKNVY